MTAANLASNSKDADLDLLREDLRGGFSCIATFTTGHGLAWMEILGPRGMRPAGEHFVSPVRTLRLWVPGPEFGPLAVAAANDDFGAGLRSIERRAGEHLPGGELARLSTVLRVVHGAVVRRRGRLPTIGPGLDEEGTPSLWGWASCLPLGDLEAALRKAVA